MSGRVYTHMGSKTVHLVSVRAYGQDVLVSALAKCGARYDAGQTIEAVNCRSCRRTVAAQMMERERNK